MRTKVYETYGVMEGKEKFPDLPRVAYVQMLQSQGLLHDTYVYGVDAKKTLSTLMTPTEIMDGAIVSGNCVSACDKTQHMFTRITRLFTICSRSMVKLLTLFATSLQMRTFTLQTRCVLLTGQQNFAVS